MMITEKTLQEDPDWIRMLTGLPAETFWQLVQQAEAAHPGYDQQRLAREERKRQVGGGRKFDFPLAIRIAMVLTYLRLHIPQEVVAKLFGASQWDVSRELRRLLPLLKEVLPVPEVWQLVEAGDELSEAELLSLAELSDGQVLVDATEQQVYRSQDSSTRQAHYSGKKKVLRHKLG
jgi:hypothetical protein